MSSDISRCYHVVLKTDTDTFQTVVKIDPSNIEASLEPVFQHLQSIESKLQFVVEIDLLKKFILKDATTYATWPERLAACKRSVGEVGWTLMYWFDRSNTPAV